MRIGIDVSALAKRERTGVARYGVSLLDAMLPLAASDAFVLACRFSRIRRAFFRYAPRAANASTRWFVDASPAFTLGTLDVFHGLDARVPPRASFPCVATIHDLGALECGTIASANFRAKKQDAYAAIAQDARHVICVSAATRDAFRARFRVPDDRLSVIHHGVDARFVAPPAAVVAALRARLRLGPRYVLFVGLVSARKNLVPLVRAFDACADALPDVQLVIAGAAGHGHADVEAAIATARSRARIVRIGFVADADLPALYAGAHAFVFPGLTEGFGMPMLEAMACGAPVIAHAAPVTAEVGGDAAVTVDARDVDQLAAALREIATNDAARTRVIACGRARAAEFSWEAAARKTLEVYRAAAGATPGSG